MLLIIDERGSLQHMRLKVVQHVKKGKCVVVVVIW